MENFMKVAVVILAIVSVATAAREDYQFETHYGQDSIANEEVQVYRKEQYAIVTVTALTGRLTSTVNLHDFATRYTAIRNDDLERCYIFRTAHTLDEMMETLEKSLARNGFFEITQEFKCVSKEFIPNEELLDRYGERVAKHCDGYEVIYSKQKFLKKSKRSVNAVAENAIACFICVGSCS